jgi:hypothetical protein
MMWIDGRSVAVPQFCGIARVMSLARQATHAMAGNLSHRAPAVRAKSKAHNGLYVPGRIRVTTLRPHSFSSGSELAATHEELQGLIEEQDSRPARGTRRGR